MKARLALETGRVFPGESFGALKETGGEVVFCTALTGYQEILTDPSYQRQIVVMTYPHIGNYGTAPELNESERPRVSGFVAREFSPMASHWKSTATLSDFMKKHDVAGLDGLDTRSLVRHLRDQGACRGVISTDTVDDAVLVERAKALPSMIGADLVQEVSCAKSHAWEKNNKTTSHQRRVALMDYGMKHNIPNSLVEHGCEVTVFPARTTFEELMAFHPDGLMLSNGPGDPAAVTYAVDMVRRVIKANETASKPLPVFGICLGHQILGLALGGKTYKLKFGHRGANHPVKDLTTGKVEVTTQNHGFAVDMASLADRPVELTHINLNDQTVEGIRHKTLPLFSVQYHPEACPGPHDSRYLFDRFIGLMS